MAALLGMLAGGGAIPSATAQVRGATAGSRPTWTPPFAPASGDMLTGVQTFMKTPAGSSLLAQLPELTAVQSFSPASESDLRVIGALAAQLPQGFENRLAAAARGIAADPEEPAALARILGSAYQAAAQLERFGIYGPVVQGKSAVVRNMAAQQALGRAQSIAGEFIRRTRVADGQGGSGKDEVVEPTSLGDGRKPMPEGWKLGGQQEDPGSEKPEPPPPGAKPASGGRTESSRRPEPKSRQKAPDPSAQSQAPSAPKPSPLSNDFYERLGADRRMSQEEIKSAYRKAGMLYHPDRYASSQSPEAIRALTVAFQRIQEAYQTLSDPKKRADYDRRFPGSRAVRR